MHDIKCIMRALLLNQLKNNYPKYGHCLNVNQIPLYSMLQRTPSIQSHSSIGRVDGPLLGTQSLSTCH